MVTGKFIAAIGLVAATSGLLTAGTARAVDKGETLPPVAVKHFQGGELTNAGLTGKVTVVNFWATWCAACKVELVEMEEQLRPLFAEANAQIAFVSLDKEPEKAAEWFQENLKEPELLLKHLYLDPKFELADLLKVSAFPLTLVIGRDGRIAYVQQGYREGEHSTEEIVKVATKLLKEAKS